MPDFHRTKRAISGLPDSPGKRIIENAKPARRAGTKPRPETQKTPLGSTAKGDPLIPDSGTSSNGNFPAMVVIFTNLSTTFTFSPDLEKAVFNIAGIPYYPPRTPKGHDLLEEMKKLCYDKIYEAVETNYEISWNRKRPQPKHPANDLYHILKIIW